jgi:hypothetical protein
MENVSSLDPSDHDMVDHTGCIDAWQTRHAGFNTKLDKACQLNI